MAIRYSSSGGTPFGDTASRPSSPQVGQTYYNGQLGYLEIYTVSGWIPATGANDFSLNITGPHTTVTFSQTYSSGSYSIVSFLNDATLDVYAYATDGSSAGYTSTKAFTATQRFNKMVIIGGSAGDVLQFSYKTTYATSATSSEVTAGPYILSLTPATLGNVNNTTTITGGNFASDVQIVFIGTDNVERSAKSVVRNSSSSLTVTRPDSLPVAYEPYSVKATNPNISSPVGSNSNILSNAIDAGAIPVWTTAGALTNFVKGNSYTYSLSATDADSSITYSIDSGSLPTGLSLNTSTGVISGTPTVNNYNNSNSVYSFVVKATDSGGNSTNSSSLTLSQVVPDAPTSVSASTSGASVVVSFTAPLYSGTSSISSYTVVESGTGATASGSSSPITFTNPTGGNRVYSVYATNSSGNSNSGSASSISVSSYVTFSATGSTQSWTAPAGVTSATFYIWGAGGANGASGGAGATGGTTTGSFTITPGATYTIYVGKTGSSYNGGWPGGGNGGNWQGAGGGGGGYSGIKNAGGTYLAIAGGGGGGGRDSSNSGAGGGSTGGSVSTQYGTNTGGTQSAGGTVGITIDTTSTAGSSLQGGSAAASASNGGWGSGGGGGAGYYGGAGGETGGGAQTGGAGGSGYVNATYAISATTTQGVVTDLVRGTAGNSNTDGKVIIGY